MSAPPAIPNGLFESKPDDDIYLGDGYPCAAGVSRGIYERIDACPNNPDLFWRVESFGNMRFFAQTEIEHSTQTDYRIRAQKSITHTAATSYEVTATTHISHTSGADYRIIAQGVVGVASNQSINTSAPVTEIISSQRITLKVGDTRLELLPEGLFAYGDLRVDGGITARWIIEDPNY